MFPGLIKFLGQENKAYRNMYIAMTLLGIHFLIPSCNYALAPQAAIAQVVSVGKFFHQTLPYREDSMIWRVLAAGNVFTLAFMCFMLASNVKRFYNVLIPLCVLKAYSSLGFLTAFIIGPRGVHHAMYFLVFLWDGLNVVFFVYFCTRARRSLLLPGAAEPVPRLFFVEGEGMRFAWFEKRWLKAVMDAILPAGASADLPWSGSDAGAVELSEDLLFRVPFPANIGLRVSLWVIYLFPPFVIRRWRTLAGLSFNEREQYIRMLNEHPINYLRLPMVLVKSVACMAYCVDQRVQDKLGMSEPSHLPAAGGAR